MSESNPKTTGMLRRRLVCLAALTVTALPVAVAANGADTESSERKSNVSSSAMA